MDVMDGQYKVIADYCGIVVGLGFLFLFWCVIKGLGGENERGD